MRAPSMIYKRVIPVIFAVMILCNSYLAPQRAHAEVASAAVIGTAIVAAGGAAIAYSTLQEYASSSGISEQDAKALTALAQTLYANAAGTNATFASMISTFKAQQVLWSGIQSNPTAKAAFAQVVASGRTAFGQTWFNFSHLGNFYVGNLGQPTDTQFKSGTVHVGYMSTSQEANLESYFAGSITNDTTGKFAAAGITGANIISGALGDVFIEQASYNANILVATAYGYCAVHATTFESKAIGDVNGNVYISCSHILSSEHSPVLEVKTYSNTLPIQAGQYVDTTNPDMQPKKVVIPPVWYNVPDTPDTTTTDDQTTGTGATTDASTGVSSIETGLSSIYGALKNLGSVISAAVMPIVNALSDFFRPYLDDITGQLQDLGQSLETFPTSINKVISNIETLPSSIADALNLETIPQTLSDIKDGILTFPQTIANAIQDALETFPQLLDSIKSTIIEKGDLIAGGISALGDYLSGIGTVISNAITGAAGATWDFLSDVVSTISTTLTNILDWTTTAVHDITLSIEGVLTDVFVPTISIEAETTAVKDILVTRFPFGVPEWFKLDEKSTSGSLSSLLTFYNGQYGVLTRDFDLLAYKDMYSSKISAIWTAFVYGLGVVALYKMLKPKVTV